MYSDKMTTFLEDSNATTEVPASTDTMLSTVASVHFYEYCDLIQDSDCDSIRILKLVTVPISIFSMTAALFCIVLLQKYKTFHQRIICHILVAELLSAIVLVGGDGKPEDFGTPNCIAQGFFLLLFDLTKLLWMCYLTVFLYFIMVKDINTGRHEWLYTTVGWVLPLSMSCLPLTTDDYGPSGAPYCWIKNSKSGTGWRFGIYWGPVMAGMCLMLATISYIFWYTKRQSRCTLNEVPNSTYQRRVENYLKPMVGYAISFLCINLVLCINRIQNVYAPPVFGLLCFHMLLASIYGIVWTTLFFTTNGRQEFTRDKFRKGYALLCAQLSTCRTTGGKNKMKEECTMSQVSMSPSSTPELPRRGIHQQSLQIAAIDLEDNGEIEYVEEQMNQNSMMA